MPPHPLARGIFRAQKLYVEFYLACLGFRRSGNIPKTGGRVNNSTESTYDTTDSSCNCCPRLTVVLVMAPGENVLINLSEQSRLHAIARRPYNEALSTWRLSSNEKSSSWRIFVSPTVARWVRLCVCCLRARVPNNNVLRLEPDAINALEIAKPMFSRCGTTCAWSQATDPNGVH